MKRVFKEVGGVFNVDFKRNVQKVSVSCAVIFLLLSTVVLQMGILSHTKHEKNKAKFLEVEKRKFDRYLNYMQYGAYGFIISVQHSPIYSLFENSSSFCDLEIFIDNSIRLKINKPQKDANIFEKPIGGSLDLSWFKLVLMGIFVLTWGFFSFRNSEKYYKFLLNFAGSGSVFWGVFLSRAFLILLFLFLELLLTIIIFFANGIVIFPLLWGLLIFLSVSYLVMIFLLLLGNIIGTTENKAKAAVTAVSALLIFVFLWPAGLNTVFSKRADNNIMSRYELESRKMKILNGFEKLINERRKEIKTKAEGIELNRSLTEKYWNDGFKRIEALEMKMIENIREKVEEFHLWSIFNPVTFYKSVNNELSSMGYNEYLRFYQYSKDKFKGFVRFYLDNILYKKNPKVISYLKDDEYIFKAKPTLPKYFGAGVLFNLFLIVLLGWISYHRFTRIIFLLPKNKNALSDLPIKMEKGKHLAFSCDYKDFSDMIYNIFFGRGKGIPVTITLNDENILPVKKQDLIYLPSPAKIPGDLKLKSLLSLVQAPLEEKQKLIDKFGKKIKQRLSELSLYERIDFFFNLGKLKNARIYLLEDLFFLVPQDATEETFKDIKAKDTVILEFVRFHPARHVAYNSYFLIFFDGSKYKQDVITKNPARVKKS